MREISRLREAERWISSGDAVDALNASYRRREKER